jgi:hypothetical protein
VRLHFTSGHHSSANGQAERTNSTLEQYLRICCIYEHGNWSKLLPLAEFAYNNTPHSTTGVSPTGFSPSFATRSYNPLIAVYPDAEITDLRACHFAVNFDATYQLLPDHMKEVQIDMARYAAWSPLLSA